MKYSFLTLFLLAFGFSTLFAQPGVISGTIVDEKTGESLIGAAVFVNDGELIGSQTDIDGRYKIVGVSEGFHTVVVQYISYQTKNIEEVEVEAGNVTLLDITMTSSDVALEAVVIKSKFRAESIGAIMSIQKNNISISNGISRDIIQRSPDNNTGEVLKRISGTTIQDGKFVIVRGLSDRYNTALVNNVLLPSTEPDRKSFSFDLFPSNMLDYLFITKTAQPDLPGEFAGGVIQLTTRDIPDKNFLSVSYGAGINSNTTFKEYYDYEGGKRDWLGIDDGTRAIPDGFPDPLEYVTSSLSEQVEYSQLMSANWGASKYNSAPFNNSAGINGGWVKEMGGGEFGGVLSLTYNNSLERTDIINQDFDASQTALYSFSDTEWERNILWGAMLNLGYKINASNKINIRNSYNINSSDATVLRTGEYIEFDQFNENEYYNFISNTLLNSTISGEHMVGSSKVKVGWNTGFARIERNRPDLRSTIYFRDNEDPEDTIFRTFFPLIASDRNNGKYYSELNENVYSAEVNASFPFQLFGLPQNLKAGVGYQYKDREFDSRIMGYVTKNPAINGDIEFLSQTIDNIIVPENINESTILIDEITNKSDAYTASSDNTYFYLMMDNKVADKLRIVWGARAEIFNQSLQSFERTASLEPEPIEIEKTAREENGSLPFNLMPSMNLTYAVNDKINLRLSGSKTVARPEFRELAPFSFFDFETNSSNTGNPDLSRTDIYNADFRFEYYPGMGQLLSAGVFYKYFDNPIEKEARRVGRKLVRKPINEDAGTNVGVEFEVRKNFDFIGNWLDVDFFDNLTFNANLAYIKSVVEVRDSTYVGVSERALQGQSPYVVNLGMSYLHPEAKFGATVLFNQIGRRISSVGFVNYADIYENSRPLLDLQLSAQVIDNGFIRFTGADLLNSKEIFYQDINENGKYDEAENLENPTPDEDNLIWQFVNGRNFSLAFSYTF